MTSRAAPINHSQTTGRPIFQRCCHTALPRFPVRGQCGEAEKLFDRKPLTDLREQRLAFISAWTPKLPWAVRPSTNGCADVVIKRGDDFSGIVLEERPRPWTMPGAAHLCSERRGGRPYPNPIEEIDRSRCAIAYRQALHNRVAPPTPL
jgi:hypothetical protein